jgi:multidrug efflux pump subunit AcrA (membrane-fusion protein)
VVLTAAAATAAGIRTEPVRPANSSVQGTAIEAPGQVEADPSRTAFISARSGGRLERLSAVVGDRVAAGQAVGFVMSPAFLTAQNDLRQAARRAVLLAATADSAGARALAMAARTRLTQLGLQDSEVDRLAGGGNPAPLLPVTAPFEGSLVESMTLEGAALEPGTPIFRIVDLRTVNIAADVPERYLPDLHVGQRASVQLAAYPELRLDGRVERIRDELDPTTRTVEALVHVANPRRVLRPGMFATVQLQVTAQRLAGATPTFVVPAGAIVSETDQRYVFVETTLNVYERRPVELALSDTRSTGVAATEVVVRGGLVPGDRVVVEGVFVLKSELAKAGFAEEE